MTRRRETYTETRTTSHRDVVHSQVRRRYVLNIVMRIIMCRAIAASRLNVRRDIVRSAHEGLER